MTTKDDHPVDPFSKPHPMGSVAKLLGTSMSTINRLRESGDLGPWFYIGSRPYINGTDIKRFIESRPAKRLRKRDDGDQLPAAAE
jgi:hypothetical protein